MMPSSVKPIPLIAPAAATRADPQPAWDPAPSQAAFRRAISQFATGVTVLTVARAGRARGMTASSFTGVSFDPPLVSVCVTKEGAFHAAIVAAGSWAASILHEDQEHLACLFARNGRRDHDAFQGIATHHGELMAAPLLDGAIAAFECETVATVDGGDHTVFLAAVRQVELLRPHGQPLLYYAGQYRQLTQEVAGRVQPGDAELGREGQP